MNPPPNESVPGSPTVAASADEHRQELLVQLLTANQGRLLSYICALLPDRDQARDVLQETNLVVWRKAHEFVEGTNFWAWASRIAHYMVLTRCRNMQRDRLVFDEDLVNELAASAAVSSDDDDSRYQALGICLGKLHQGQLNLLQSRYVAGVSVVALAAQMGQSADAIGMRLYRIRQILLKCIKRTLGERAK